MLAPARPGPYDLPHINFESPINIRLQQNIVNSTNTYPMLWPYWQTFSHNDSQLKIDAPMDNAPTAADLDRRFGIPNTASVVVGNGGLPKVQLTSPLASGEIYLHGAQATSWHPTGATEALFVSCESAWQQDKAIRGGVPICFPWFGDKTGDPNAPVHGFARTKPWRLDAIQRSGDDVTVMMSTASDQSTNLWWPADFHLSYRATFGAALVLELELRNTGHATLQFEEALHCYFRVGDVRHVRVIGLDSVDYLDKTDGYRKKTQRGNVTVTSETDCVYLDTQSSVELVDPNLRRSVHITKDNSYTTVIWNPWAAKAAAMSDLGDNEWMQMICVETSNVLASAVKLAPGQSHQMRALIAVSPL